MKTLYNLPVKVIFCKNCVMSNQRPSSMIEFKHDINRKNAKYLNIDAKTRICDACKVNEVKKNINWKLREKELLKLLEKHRGKHGEYDCIVPGSGGKDSAYAAHILKYKYKMNPLTITWPPIMYTDYGYENFKKWIEVGGFDNVTLRPNGKIMNLLTSLSIKNILHPFQTFILGQKNLAPKLAKKFNIPLVFYGESESEYGNPIAESHKSLRKKEYYSENKISNIILGGVPIKNLIKDYKISYKDLYPFLPIQNSELNNFNLEIHYLGYYLKWKPQEVYYYAVENTGFKARPFRTQGTYSKYNSIDDKIDDLHYYTTYIKFGLGRASYDASQEIRNEDITRDEGINLVKKFDGEFPNLYIDEILNHLNIKKDDFLKSLDKFRPMHLWKKTKEGWKLKHTVNLDGCND